MNTFELDLLIDLESNIADEASAREGYYRLLRDYSSLLSDQEIDAINEIIAEELKHTEILRKMIYLRNYIKPEN